MILLSSMLISFFHIFQPFIIVQLDLMYYLRIELPHMKDQISINPRSSPQLKKRSILQCQPSRAQQKPWKHRPMNLSIVNEEGDIKKKYKNQLFVSNDKTQWQWA